MKNYQINGIWYTGKRAKQICNVIVISVNVLESGELYTLMSDVIWD